MTLIKKLDNLAKDNARNHSHMVDTRQWIAQPAGVSYHSVAYSVAIFDTLNIDHSSSDQQVRLRRLGAGFDCRHFTWISYHKFN
jgi:hypothetical protein